MSADSPVKRFITFSGKQVMEKEPSFFEIFIFFEDKYFMPRQTGFELVAQLAMTTAVN